jgi:hypothetical protein
MSYREPTIDTETCPGCRDQVPSGCELCPQCGSPVDIGRYAELVLGIKPALRSARRALFFSAALSALGLLLALAPDVSPAAAAVQLAVAALFVVAAALVGRWPFSATLAGLCLFVFVETTEVAADPAVLFPTLGLFMHLAVLYLLYHGVRAGYRARDVLGQAGRHDRTVAIAAVALSLVAGVVLSVVS